MNPNQLPARYNSASTAATVYDPNSNVRFDEDEIDLRVLWRVIMRYRKLIAIVFAFAVLTTLLITLMMRPMYTASVSMEVNTSGRNLVKFQNVENQDPVAREFIATQSKILASDAVATEVINRLNLTDQPEFNGGMKQRGIINGLRSIINLFRASGSVEESEEIRRAISIYQDRLSVNQVRNTSLVTLNFEGFDPELAAEIANAHAQSFINLSDSRRFNSTSGAKAFLEKEISNIQAKLETSEKQLNDFARKNGVVDLEDSNNIMMARLSNLNQGLSEVQNQRIDAETRYVQSNTANAETLASVFDDELIKSLREEQSSIQAEYLELSRIYKPRYPVMQQLRAKIDEIEANIQNQANKIVDGLKTSFEQLSLRETLITEELEKLKSTLLDLQDRVVTYNILKREWESNKELYSGLLERTKEVGVAAGMELNIASVIDPASVPGGASSPKLTLNLLIASFLGLAGGLGAAFLLSMLDNSVHDVEQLQQLTNIGHLGVAPEIVHDKTISDGDGDGGDETDEASSENVRRKFYDTMAHHDPSSWFAEEVQSLRTSLSFARAGGFPKSLLITSSVAGEGKSTMAMNLAISCAKSGQRVVVVEADMRKARYSKAFGLSPSTGLSDALVGGGTAKPLQVKKIPSLHLIVAGSKAPNPVDLLGSNAMRQLIENLEEEYDLVVVDCPPVLGLADTIVMSTVVKAVVIVVAAHQTPRDAVKNSIARLRMVGAPIIGTVLNKVQPHLTSYDYYSYEYGLEDDAKKA